MKIEFEGRTWQLDADDITNRQSEKIFAHTGLSVSKWLNELEREDDPSRFLPAWEGLYWLMLQQNDETGTAISDVEFAVYKFAAAFMEAAEALAPAKEAEPDPTRPPAGSAPSPVPATRKAGSGRGGGVKPDG